MFDQLNKINRKPELYEFYTAKQLWTDEYIAGQMLSYHLNPDVDLASRKHEFISRAVDWISSTFELGRGKNVCDLGCGPGLYTSRLAASNASITGVDFSANSLAYASKTAKEHNLDIEYVLSDYLSFETDRKFDLITMIFWDFCALAPEKRGKLLNKCQGWLKPGGKLLMDVLAPAHYDSIEPCAQYEYSAQNGFWSPDPHYVFTNIFKYEEHRVVLMKYTIVEQNRRRESFNWLKCFTPEELIGEFADNGLCVVNKLGNVAGDAFDPGSTEFAVIAQKA